MESRYYRKMERKLNLRMVEMMLKMFPRYIVSKLEPVEVESVEVKTLAIGNSMVVLNGRKGSNS